MTEKQIAQAIVDAQKMHEESYVPNQVHGMECGEHSKEWSECFIEACKKNGLDTSMWYLLDLANHWFNDIDEWAKAILAGKDIFSLFVTFDNDHVDSCTCSDCYHKREYLKSIELED